MTSGKTFARVRDVEFSFDGLGAASRCRVQVFKMRGETVVLATQRLEGDGTSLVNVQEQAVDAVTAQLLNGHGPQRWYQVLIGSENNGGRSFQLVTAVSGLERTAEFAWSPVTVEELDGQLGHRPDLTRGDSAPQVPVSPALPPDRFQVVAPLLLPVPAPWQGGECMPPRSRSGWVKALVRRPGPGCTGAGCSYHSVDWTVACWAAVRALRQVRRDGAADQGARARALLAAELEGAALFAAESLFRDPVALPAVWWRRPDAYGNGQHRTRAMLDQGVPVTVILARP